MALAVPAFAQQPSAAVDDAACAPQMAAIEHEMDMARARGQMLRRQQLANQLSALQARCSPPAAQGSRAARMAALEHEIETLRVQLERAEEQLRQLQHAPP